MTTRQHSHTFGFGIVFIDQSGITTPFTTPQFPFIHVQQKTQDNLRPAFALSQGPSVRPPIPLTPDAGLGQSVYTADRQAGSGYVQQWNLAVQHAITNSAESHTSDRHSRGHTRLQPQPAHGRPACPGRVVAPDCAHSWIQIPSSSIGGRTVTQAQLLISLPQCRKISPQQRSDKLQRLRQI